LPRFFTLESFVAEALQYGLRQKPRINGPERLLRLAAAWHDLTGRAAGPGVVHQLDRYIRDCQACKLKPSPTSKDAFDRLGHRYLSELNADDRLDRMSAVGTLVEEISDKDSWPNRMFLGRFEAIVIDGFHRFEPLELDLIAALSHERDVVLWLVGIPGTPSWRTVEATTAFLKEKGDQTGIVDRGFEDSTPATKLTLASPFREIGRRLFRREGAPLLARRATESPPELFKLEVVSPLDEVETVARQIKADYLDSQDTDHPLRLSDVAVIIPGPAYDPLIREAFPRAGLEFNLAGRALLVSTSRPARALLAAINLIQGRWRYDLLLDFLSQPFVLRQLKNAHRLDQLFERRPRARRRMDHALWSQSWKKQIERLEKSIEGWRSGRLDLPERTTLSRDEFVAKQVELAAELSRLITSIESVLTPVDAMSRAMESPSEEKPLGNLIDAMGELLGLLEIDRWLTPPRPVALEKSSLSNSDSAGASPSRAGPSEGPVLWVEYEKDQNAYLKLLAILENLKEVPARRLPKRGSEPGGINPPGPDVLAALRLALDGETYQIKTEDDAGVQIFELREIRGLRFRHVYVLGLVNGQIPRLPEEGPLVRRRLQHPVLKVQLEEKEAEVQFLFSQVFEAAQEKLVLSRPTREGDRPTLPSPFFTAVNDLITLPELDSSNLVTGKGQAAYWLGRAQKGKGTKILSDLWPDISAESTGELEPVLNGLTIWQERPSGNDLAVDWPEMLQVLFPDEHLFSASQLEMYAACPFRYFGKQVLRLEEREADPTRMHYGSLVHRVLQRFYEEKRQRTKTVADQPLPAVSRADRQRLVQLFDEEKSQLDDGLLTPDLEMLFVCGDGVIDLLLEMLEIIEGEEANFGNLSTEFPIDKVLLGQDISGRPVLLTGKIDRVDRRRQDRRNAMIVDYKTGGIPKRSAVRIKVVDGRMLQLPLYAAGLQLLDAEVNVIGGAYAHLNERSKAKKIGGKEAIVSLGELSNNETDVGLWDTQAARDLALEFASQIRAGRFPLTRHGNGSEEAECTPYCPLRHACRHPEGYTSSKRYW
jgi:hypothetical protein